MNAASYLKQFERIGGDLRTFQMTVDARMTELVGHKPWTFKANVAVRLPDSVRIDVLDSSNGLFRGWKFARVGSKVQLFDPISERVTATDLAKITGREPVRMDLGIDLLEGSFRPGNYTLANASRVTFGGKPAVLLKLIPKTAVSPSQSVMRLSHILVWMDPVKKAPIRQESWGNLPALIQKRKEPIRLASMQFSGFRPDGPGLWYPSQVDVTQDSKLRKGGAPNHLTLKMTRLNGVLMLTELSGGDKKGFVYQHYSHIRVNQPIPESTFHPGA